MDEPDFLKLIRNNPDDDEPRLLLADWYEEQGEPRGEFIRLQCELHRMHPSDQDVPGKQERVQQLLDKHRSRWLRELPKIPGLTWGSHVSAPTESMWDSGRQYFRRGMVELVTLNKRQIRDNIGALQDYAVACCPTVGSEMPGYVWQLLNRLPTLRSADLFQKKNPFDLLNELNQFS